MHAKVTLIVPALVLLLHGGAPPVVDSAKILAIYPFPGKSHFMMHNALIASLVHRGHQVTMVTAFTLQGLNLGQNYTEILVEPVYDFWHDVHSHFGANNVFEMTNMGVVDFLKMLEIVGTGTTEHALRQPKVQAIINASPAARRGSYDLLLAEQFYQEAFLPLAQLYNIPVVTSSTLGFENSMSQMMGVISPWAFVPHGFLPFTDRMTFVERIQNTFYSLYEDFDREFKYFPKMDALVNKYFANSSFEGPFAPVSVLEKNISLMLLNSYAPLTTVRPKVDGMIPVGGMQIYPPKALPADIQQFLDGATSGSIYFSLGSNVQSKDMPLEMLRLFLDVFRQLDQRVLWKFEDENIPDLPANVMIRKWLPQSDILAHRSVKAFITHGGLFSTQESIHYAVPMLGIPFYSDQHLNLKKAVQSGYAITLRLQSITTEKLHNALKSLIKDVGYRRNVMSASRIFRDRPQPARETAVYWVEHVIRHNGASHLRSAALDLRWYQLYLLDVIGVATVVLLSSPLILFMLLRHFLAGSGQKRKSKNA